MSGDELPPAARCIIVSAVGYAKHGASIEKDVDDMRRVIGFLLLVMVGICFSTSALGEMAFIPQMDAWNLEVVPLEVNLWASVSTHMPFDEERTAQLNALLNHLSLRLNWQHLEEEEWSRLAILVDGAEALSASQREKQGETLLQFSVQPDNTYLLSSDNLSGDSQAMLSFLGGEKADLSIYGLHGDEEAWLEDGLALLENIGQDLDAYKKEGKIKQSIKNMGTARVKQTYTIPKADAAILGEAIANNSLDGELRELLTSLTFSGKQTLTLYRAEGGEILRADYSGNCGVDEDHMRKVTLTWKLRRDSDAVRDHLTLKSPAVSGSDRNTVTLERSMLANDKGQINLDEKFTYEWVADRKKTTLSGTVDLTNDLSEEASHVTGTVTIKQVLPGEDKSTSIRLTPDLTVAGADGLPSVLGSVTVEQLSGKNVMEKADLSVTLGVGGNLSWESRPQTVSINLLTEEQAAITASELSSAAATALIRPMVLLPREDTLYLSADLSDEAWQKIVDAAQSALQ